MRSSNNARDASDGVGNSSRQSVKTPMKGKILGVLGVVVIALPVRAYEPVSDTAPVRQSLKRSLTYLQKDGVQWIEEQSCVTCHQIPSMLSSHNQAVASGLDVDNKKLAASAPKAPQALPARPCVG